MAYCFKGDLDGDIGSWEKIASIDPGYENMRNDLSVSYKDNGSFHDSIAGHESVIEELGNRDRNFLVVYPACAKENDILVVNRSKL